MKRATLAVAAAAALAGLGAAGCGTDTVAFIEWPDAAEPGLDRVALSIEISHAGADRRRITF